MSDVYEDNWDCAAPTDRPTPENLSENLMEDEEIHDDENAKSLSELHILNMFHHDEDDAYNEEDDDGESDRRFDNDVHAEEVEAMLEEGLPAKYPCEKQKYILKDIGHSHSDMLPEGWVRVNHNSGMPIYLHKESRVCTMAKPYFLGPGSARNHEIPLSAIPCLQYRRALDAVAEEQHKVQEAESSGCTSEDRDMQQDSVPVVDASIPNASIETLQECKVTQTLTHMEVQDYCRKLFEFETIKVKQFNSWPEKRKYIKERQQQEQLQHLTLPDRSKCIKFPLQNPENAGHSEGHAQKEWVLNPKGKNYISILNEYSQHTFNEPPLFSFTELEYPCSAFSATVTINIIQYGKGYGTSKKLAKLEAAKATLEILIPDIAEKIQVEQSVGTEVTKKLPVTHLSLFDKMEIEDPQVTELCKKTMEPMPYATLKTCLQRNLRLGEMQKSYKVNPLRQHENEFTITVGQHVATVICKNKHEGKQRASQVILKALHPYVDSWGVLLRLYGSRALQSIQEKSQEELRRKQAGYLQSFAVFNKVKQEIVKFRDSWAAQKPTAKFVLLDDENLSSSSDD